MDFRQLEAFANVLRLGSFSRAAEHLFLSQPTVSAHIKALEAEIGCPLIIRAAREAYPTERGKQLYAYAIELLSLRDRALEDCGGRAARCGGMVRVAASTVPYRHILPGATASFREAHPDVRFTLTSGDSTAVAGEILSGRAEIGLTGTRIEAARIEYATLCTDELVIVTPMAAPFDSLPSDTLLMPEDLLRLDWIVREPGSGTQREAEANLRARGIEVSRLHVAAQMDNPDAIQHAVRNGLGIAALSRLSCAEYAQLGFVRLFRVQGGPIERRLYTAIRRKGVLCSSATAFLRHLHSER